MQVQRTENKFLINRKDALLLIARLDAILPRDKHATSPQGYEVRSLYFDTPGDRCFVEKMDGLLVHEKFRARIYSPQDTMVKLECKHKTGEFQTKRTLLISREMLEALCRGDYARLLELPDPLAPFFYEKLMRGAFRPKNIVQYQRLSFCLDLNNIRITFDSDIRATESCLDLFQQPLLTHPLLPPDQLVLEVKFNNFLPGYLQNALRGLHKSPASYSKYANGRSFYRSLI